MLFAVWIKSPKWKNKSRAKYGMFHTAVCWHNQCISELTRCDNKRDTWGAWSQAELPARRGNTCHHTSHHISQRGRWREKERRFVSLQAFFAAAVAELRSVAPVTARGANGQLWKHGTIARNTSGTLDTTRGTEETEHYATVCPRVRKGCALEHVRETGIFPGHNIQSTRISQHKR